MLEFLTLVGLPAVTLWIVWKVRATKRASDAAVVHQAWQVVLDDPNYLERRHFEERKRVVDDARMHHGQETRTT